MEDTNIKRSGVLRIVIDASMETLGGVEQALVTLVRSLGRLEDGAETYKIILGCQQKLENLKKYVSHNQQLILKAPTFSQHTDDRQERRASLADLGKKALRSLLSRTLHSLRRIEEDQSSKKMNNSIPAWPQVPISDGFYESLGCDVIHFPFQGFVLCAMPSVYNPHDLQYLHFPQFFTPIELAWREAIFPAGCRIARTVIVGSQWVKDDIARWYRIDPDKVQVIPEGPPTQSYPEPSEDLLRETKRKYQLEQPFMLYPSVTWAHKNHIRLMQALAFLRDKRDLFLRLVCIGSRHERFWPEIEKRLHDLKLENQVRFLGYVPEEDLRPLYRLAQFLVEPSLFEASSLPIFEAWLEGTPVACSNATALPGQVMDAALLFDPNSTESIANTIVQMASNKELREEFRTRGYQRLNDFDCERTAKAYRAVYRRTAGYPLTEEDKWLLSWDWMREPKRKMETQPK